MEYIIFFTELSPVDKVNEIIITAPSKNEALLKLKSIIIYDETAPTVIQKFNHKSANKKSFRQTNRKTQFETSGPVTL